MRERTQNLDLVLINPGCRAEIYQSLASDMSAIEPPTWCLLIAEFMRSHGYSVDIIDAEALHLTPEATARGAIDCKPVLVAVIVYGHHPSASTQNMTAAGQVCSALKNLAPEVPVVMGGGHPSALPERTLREERVDYVAQGEGHQTIQGLVDYLENAQGELPAKVPGLWYRNGDQIMSTPGAPLSRDLDTELPGMAWDLLPMARYRAHNWHCFDRIHERQPYASLYTTLGCPFKCTFCCINAPFGGPSYRFWSPAWVARELSTLVERYGVRNIKIVDEMFFLNQKHVSSICDEIISRGLDLNIWVYGRVDTIKDALLEKMRKAGITWLALGIESASERVRDDVDKSFTQEQLQKVFDRLHATDISIIGNFIFGLPEDDLETMEATLKMSIELDCDFVNFYVAMAYPGSKLYGEAAGKGWPLPERWHGYSQYSEVTRPLPTKYLSAADVLRFRDRAFDQFFAAPRYIRYVEKRFGPETVEHIRTMSGRKLIRTFA